MQNFRLYGEGSFGVVLVHGGPGALGDMGYVAERLSVDYGVVEALQTKQSIDELIDELEEIIKMNCDKSVILIGHSWGAGLAYLLAAEKPELVSELVLVGSGPFEAEYARDIEATRMGRLKPDERNKLEGLLRDFYNGTPDEKGQLMGEIGAMIGVADAYELMPRDDSDYGIDIDGDMFSSVWNEAAELRRSGELLNKARKIKCDVTVIHGDYDPHPAIGVIDPLEKAGLNIHKEIIPYCGHYPWKEAKAHDRFFEIIRQIIYNRA